MEKPIIELINVSAHYGSILALENISLSVYAQDLLGVFGPNGGGKSTLLKLLLGLVPPSTGSIRVFGQSPCQVRRRLGYVPQHSEVNRSFPATVLDLVLMGSLPRKPHPFFRFPQKSRDKAHECLATMGIKGLESRLLSQLSGGQLQRVLIARTLMSQPDLILLDEPTASVDTETKRTIYELLMTLRQQGTTVLIVSHDTAALASVVSRVACLDQTLHYHGDWPSSTEAMAEAFGCSVEMAMFAFHAAARTIQEAGEGGV